MMLYIRYIFSISKNIAHLLTLILYQYATLCENYNYFEITQVSIFLGHQPSEEPNEDLKMQIYKDKIKSFISGIILCIICESV